MSAADILMEAGSLAAVSPSSPMGLTGACCFEDVWRLPESAGSALGPPGLWNRPKGVEQAPTPAVDPPSPG